jgi:hypothetical protein
MDTPDATKPTSRWWLLLFLVVFVGTAWWGGAVLARNGAKKTEGKPSNPYEDRSLFGR